MSTPIRIRAITPGQVINRELGMTEVSKACNVAESTVWRWAQKRPRGTGGVVPANYHVPLLHLAHRLGVMLTADDLVLGRNK